jgi:acyl-CoA thioesterase
VAELSAPKPGAFDRDSAVTREESSPAGSVFAAEVSPDWRAGRGPHGGYLAAMLLRALIETVDDPTRAPRSLTIHYARAPLPGPVRIHTVMERPGRSLSTLSARIEQDGNLVALALAAFSLPWSAPEIVDLTMPEVAPAEEGRTTGTLRELGAPPFTRHLVFQPRIGTAPFSGSEQPMEIGGWLGLGEPRAIEPLLLAFFSDALFPPVFVRLSERAVSPTVDLTIHFRAPLRPAGETGSHELCLARFRSSVVHEGFFEEDGVIWAADGTVLAQSRQLALLLPVPAG